MSRELNLHVEMLRAAAIQSLKNLQQSNDSKVAHEQADFCLCSLLAGLGFEDVVKQWDRVEKNYE